MMPEDTFLLQELKAGKPDAFASLFDTYADRLYRLGMSLVGDPFEAEDIVQEAFLKAITHIDSFQARSSLGTWLYRVVYNSSIDRLRSRVDNPLPEESDPDENSLPMPEVLLEWHTPEALAISNEGQDYLDQAIQSLPGALRSVFVLRDIEELSTAQTAEILGIGESLVKVRLHRARLALREQLAVYFAERLPDKGKVL
jgi:RNA polymerase sigma-70 factor (ECF subfamily)